MKATLLVLLAGSLAVSPSVRAATFTVINTNSAGAGSLEQAIFDANTNAGTDTISFAITNLSNTIRPAVALPSIVEPVTIDGRTQAGFVSTPIVEISGGSAGAAVDGLKINTSNCVISALVINGFLGDQIEITNGVNNMVEGCYLGLNLAGTVDASTGLNGVLITNAAINTIGGLGATNRNFISGNNQSGIAIGGASSVSNSILGNVIGLNVTNNAVVNSADGIRVNAPFTLIGGNSSSARNIISGNTGDGIESVAPLATNMIVRGNWIGTDINGVLDRGNTVNGILANAGASIIGGSSAGEGNVISGNNSDGIELTSVNSTNSTILGNIIGADVTGTLGIANTANGILITTSSRSNIIGGVLAGQANTIAFNGQDGINVAAATANTNNTFRGNSIFSNGTTTTELGIDLGVDGIGANDSGDPDTGANHLQNFPVLAWVTNSATETTFSGSLNSRPSTTYTIDLYANTTTDTAGSGEGQYYLGATNLTTGADSNLTFTISLPVASLPARFISATATDPFGNTSEFATNVFAQSTSPGQTFTVINTNNSGSGSLRQAILDANTTVTAGDTIAFAITNLSRTISLASALPTITDTVTIDGSTQPGFVGAPIVELNGAGAGSSVDGLKISASNCVVRALVINRFLSDGIELNGGRNNTIEGCYLGLNLTGLTDQGNTAAGVFIIGSSSNLIGGLNITNRNYISGNSGGVSITSGDSPGNRIFGNVIGLNVTNGVVANAALGITTASAFTRIGGSASGARNIISGNGDGMNILHPATNSVVQGNYIGTDPTGTLDRGNTDDGIVVTAGGVIVGGSGAGEGNLISGNNAEGIELNGVNSTNGTVRGNIIGADVSGTLALPNATSGILITTSSRSNVIGGVLAGEANIIAFNGTDGINVAAATANTNNTFRGNSIFSNGNTTRHLGIELGADGIAANDVNDMDTGANQLQNFPVLVGVTNSLTGTDIGGSLNSAANTTYILDFYSNPTPDTGGSGEGKTYLGSANVTTDVSGSTNFVVTIGATNLSSRYVTATATDPFGNTSEFGTNIFASSTVPGLNLVVTNTNDSGLGSLREAITQANAAINAGDTITFNIPGAGVQIISPISALPAITDPVTINGHSQPGASANTLSNGHNAVLLIRLNGTSAGAGVDGLRINSLNCVVQGLAIGGFIGDGIEISGGSNNRIEDCYLGLDPDGTTRRGNSANGVNIISSSTGNTVGGETPAARCIISANNRGIVFTSVAANNVKGCCIGTDASGTLDRGNTNSGVLITGSTARFNTIGGTNVESRNVISGNGENFAFEDHGVTILAGVSNSILGNYIGLRMDGADDLGNEGSGVYLGNGAVTNFIGSSVPGAGNVISGNNANGIDFSSDSPDQVGNVVQGNLIGPDATGNVNVGNNGHGISFSFADFNQIGGINPGDRNVISANGGSGVNINCCAAASNRFEGNFVGVDITGTNAMGNGGNGFYVGSPGNIIGGTAAGAGNIIANNGDSGVIHFISSHFGVAILGNNIYSNSGIGIDLGLDGGPTGNDASDTDEGANHLQNFPELTSVLQYPSNTVIQATLNSRSNTTYRVEFFDNASADSSGFGQGQTYLGFTNIITDASGDVAFSFTNATSLPFGHYITATATDPTNNTSEFSAVRKVVPFDSVDLNIVIADSDDPASRSTNHLYTLLITNSGPANAGSVFVTNTLPVGMNFVSATPSQGSASHSAGVVMCNLGGIANGGSASVVLAVSTTNTAVFLDEAVVVASAQLDHTPDNNSTSEATMIGIANLAISITDSPDPVVAGQPLTLTTTVSNLGPDSATMTIVDVVVDGNCVITGASASQGSFTQNGNSFSYAAGTIAVGSNTALTISVIPVETANLGHSGNTYADEVDPDAGDNSVIENTQSTNGPGVLRFSLTSQEIAEDAGSVTVEVLRSGGAIGTVSVGYATSNFTAVAGGDFTSISGTLMFTNGQTLASFTVPVLNDLLPECVELFTTRLFNATGGALLIIETNSSVAIFDDQIDAGGNVQAASATATNGPTGDSYSYLPQISADGGYAAFVSYSSNLTSNDTNSVTDVFLQNVANGALALVSVNLAGTGPGNHYSDTPRLSADGRFVTFYSKSSNLVTNDTEVNGDIFRRDVLSNVTVLVSVNFWGTNSGNSYSYNPDITPDGRFIAFYSQSSDLVTNDVNGSSSDVFLRDMTSNRVELISVNAAGTGSANGDSYSPVVSPSGRFVAFQSLASNLGPGDTNSFYDIYVRDRLIGTNYLCSRSVTGNSGDANSYGHVISANEQFVVFASDANDLVASDTNSTTDVFAYDLLTHTLQLVSVSTGGGTGNSYSDVPVVSADGRYVAFYGDASNLVANDNNTVNDVFVRDLVAGTTVLVSANCQNNTGGDSDSQYPQISADGRYVTFQSYARDLVSGHPVGFANTYRRDLLNSTTVLISQNRFLNGPGNEGSYDGLISTNGNVIAFASSASDLILSDTNNTNDVFVWRAGAVATSVDIVLTKTASTGSVVEYDNFTYTLGVTNNGSAAASGVSVSDPLPVGVSFVSAVTSQGTVSNSANTIIANVGTLGAGAGAGITITVTATNASSVTNIASGTCIEADSNPANNTGSVAIIITPLMLPTLSAQPTNTTQLLVSWPASTPSSFGLETTTNLTPVIVWSSVTNAVSISGTNKFVILDVNVVEPERYYRLRQ